MVVPILTETIVIVAAVGLFVFLVFISIGATTLLGLWLGSGGVLFILSTLSPLVNLATLGVTVATTALVGSAALTATAPTMSPGGTSKESVTRTSDHPGGTVISNTESHIVVRYDDGTTETLSDPDRISQLYYDNFKYNTEIFPEIPFGNLLVTLTRTYRTLDAQEHKSTRTQITAATLRLCANVIRTTMFMVNMYFLNLVLPLLPKSDLEELDQKFPWLDVYHVVLMTRKKHRFTNALLNIKARFNHKYGKLVFERLGNRPSLLGFIDHYVGIIQYAKDNDLDLYINKIAENHDRMGISGCSEAPDYITANLGCLSGIDLIQSVD